MGFEEEVAQVEGAAETNRSKPVVDVGATNFSPTPQEIDNPEDALDSWLENELTLRGVTSGPPFQRILKDYLDMKNLVRTGDISLEDIYKLIAEQGKSDESANLPENVNTPTTLASNPESLFLQLHGEPYPHPSEIGGFRFVSRFEWDAADINPGVGGDPEGIYNSTGNPVGYLIYEQIYDIPFEEIYMMIVLHDTGIASTGFGVTSTDPFDANIERMHIMQVNSHQKPPDIDKNGNDIADTGNDWADLGYQFVIATDGTIFEGRDIRARGANVELVEDTTTKEITVGNTGIMGIALIGNDEVEEPTPEQIAALEALLNYLLGFMPNISCIAGHGFLNPEEKKEEGNDLAKRTAEKYDRLEFDNCYSPPSG